MLLVTLVFMLIMYSVRLRIVNEAIIRVEDGLAASCLAALHVDMEQYTESYFLEYKKLVIDDYEGAYEIFESSLKTNLGLQDQFFNPYNNVMVDSFIVYNVLKESSETSGWYVISYEFDETGFVNSSVGAFGSVYAPNGMLVDETGVYAKIQFQVEGWGGQEINGSKQLLTGVKYRQ